MCEIVRLPNDEYDGYEYPYDYISELYYDVRIRDTLNGFSADFVRMPFPKPFVKDATEKLFDQVSDAPEAYGIFHEEKLIAVMEISPVFWNNRLRILGLWVHQEHRGNGHGKKLIDMAKQRCRALGLRGIVLETQSSNARAIGFYIAQGFMLAGFDAYAYSNEDIEKKEVRIELMWRPPRYME